MWYKLLDNRIYHKCSRVAVVGNVDAGKSTLLGVLTHGELDNGRGYARQRLFRHKHEAESGRTSSVGNDILGFDSMGEGFRWEYTYEYLEESYRRWNIHLCHGDIYF